MCLCVCKFVVWACAEAGGSADSDNITAQGHQKASKRCYGSATWNPGPGCRSHWKLHHVSTIRFYIIHIKMHYIMYRIFHLTYMKVDGECLDSRAPCFMVLGLWWICTKHKNLLQSRKLVCLLFTRWSPLYVRTRSVIHQLVSTCLHVWRYWDRCVYALTNTCTYCRVAVFLFIVVWNI